MTPAPVVDSHQHFWWNPSTSEYPWMTEEFAPIRHTFGPGDLRPHLAASGVDYTVLVQTRSSLPETRRFLQLAADTDFIAGVVGWVDLADPDVDATLRELQNGSGGEYLVGIRHQVHDECDPRWLLRDQTLRGLDAVRRADLAYDLLVRPRELPAAREVARRLPDLRFVVDHLAKPPIAAGEIDAWAYEMEGIAELRNVYCKLSGMVTEADWRAWKAADLLPYTDRVLTWFGSDRLMYGSDWPVCLLAASYGAVFDAYRWTVRNRPEAEQIKIFGTNAIHFYRLHRAGAAG